QPAYPVWLDVGGCGLDPIFDVPGGGRRGSTYAKSTTSPAPFTGRIVAALGHLHGGGRSAVLSQPACGDRELLRSLPTWGGPGAPSCSTATRPSTSPRSRSRPPTSPCGAGPRCAGASGTPTCTTSRSPTGRRASRRPTSATGGASRGG